MNMKQFLEEHPFMTNTDIMERYDVSITVASKKRREIVKAYNFNVDYFPRQCIVPTWAVIDYFENGGKKLPKQ